VLESKGMLESYGGKCVSNEFSNAVSV